MVLIPVCWLSRLIHGNIWPPAQNTVTVVLVVF